MDLDAAVSFVATHGRVLDRRRLRLLLGAGSPDDVIAALDAYRNPDGGYGWALEPDQRSATSQPVAAMHALEVFADIRDTKSRRPAELCEWLAGHTLPDGGVPLGLPYSDTAGSAPLWADADATVSSLQMTTQLAAQAHRLARHRPDVAAHPWLAAATAYCLEKIDQLTGAPHAYELMFSIHFLDAVGDKEPRARALTDRLIRYVVSDGPTPVAGGAEGEVLHVLNFSPFADAPSRRSFTEEAVAADLVRLAGRQQPDAAGPSATRLTARPPSSSGVATRRSRPSPPCAALARDRRTSADRSGGSSERRDAGGVNRKRMSVSRLSCQDLAMLVTLTPGVDRDRVLELLRSASIQIGNNHGKQDGYVRWVLDVGRMLRGQIARSDLDQLLFTPAFYRLVDPALMGTPQGGLLLEAEISERKTLLTASFETLRAQIGSWTAVAGKVLAVVDSSVFLSHPAWTRDDDPTAVIASIPWAEELGVGFEDIMLVLPEVVIREFDRLKESGNQKTRYRASVTLAVIDKLLADPYGTVTIRTKGNDWEAVAARGEMPRGAIQLQVFYDDPAHRPLPDPDVEIIDRAVAVQTLAGSAVRLVTMDTGMGLNARRAGLQVSKPVREIEAPPAEGQSTRGRRRAAATTAETAQ